MFKKNSRFFSHAQKQTLNTHTLKTLNIFFTVQKNHHLFLFSQSALYYSTSQKNVILKMSLNEKKRRRSSSSMKRKTSLLNLAFGTVGVFTLALSSSSPAEAKTQKHRSGDDGRSHGVGETQVRGSSSSASSSSSLKRNAKEHRNPLARTKGENDAASLGGKYERSKSKLGDVLVPPKAPPASVAEEGKLGSTTIESLSRDGDEERARDDRETDETMKKLDGYFNFDDNASNNKASEEKKSSASSLSSNDDAETAEEAKTKVEFSARKNEEDGSKTITSGTKIDESISDKDALDAYFSAKSSSSQAASVASSSSGSSSGGGDLSSAVKTALDARADEDPSLEDLKSSLKSGKTVNGEELEGKVETKPIASTPKASSLTSSVNMEVEAEKLLKEVSEETEKSLSSTTKTAATGSIDSTSSTAAASEKSKYVPITTSHSMRSLSPIAQKYLRPRATSAYASTSSTSSSLSAAAAAPSLHSDLASSARSLYSRDASTSGKSASSNKNSIAAKYANMFSSRSSDASSSSGKPSTGYATRSTSSKVSVAHPYATNPFSVSHTSVRPKVASIMSRFTPKDTREAKAGMNQDDCDEIKEELEDVKDENNTLEEQVAIEEAQNRVEQIEQEIRIAEQEKMLTETKLDAIQPEEPLTEPELEDKLEKLTTKLEAINAQNEIMTEQTEVLNAMSKMSSSSSEYKELAVKMSELNDASEAVKADAAGVPQPDTSEAEELASQIEELQSKLEEAEAALEDKDDELDEAKGQIDEVYSDYKGAKDDAENYKDDVEDLSKQLDDANAEITTDKVTISQVQSEEAQVSSEKEVLAAENSRLQMQLSSYDAEKEKLIEEIQTLGATVDDMDERQAKLAELDLLNKKIELVEEANAMSEVFKLQEENLQHRAEEIEAEKENLDATGTPYTNKAATVEDIDEAIEESKEVLKEVIDDQDTRDEDLASTAEDSENEVQTVLKSEVSFPTDSSSSVSSYTSSPSSKYTSTSSSSSSSSTTSSSSSSSSSSDDDDSSSILNFSGNDEEVEVPAGTPAAVADAMTNANEDKAVVTTMKNRDTNSVVDLNDPVVEVDVSAAKGIDLIRESEAKGVKTGESYPVQESIDEISAALLAVDEGKALETTLLLKGVTAANFTEADEIAGKGVFAEAVDANLEDVVLVSVRDSVIGEEATLAKAPKDGAADVKSRAKEAVLRSRSIARHAAALGLAQSRPELGVSTSLSSSSSGPRKALKEKTNDDDRDYLNEYIKKVKAKKDATLNAAVANRKSTSKSFALPTTSSMKMSLTNKDKVSSSSAKPAGAKPMAMAKSKNFAASTTEETTTATAATDGETATEIRMVVLTDDVDSKELLIAERFSDPDVLGAIVARLQATGVPALASDVDVILIEQRKNKYDEFFSFLPEPVRNAIHWTANKIEFAFEGLRDWLVDTFHLTISESDGITGAIMGGLAVVIIYLVLRSMYRRFVRYRLRQKNNRSSGGYGGGTNNNDESRPLYRESSETKGGQTTTREYSSQQYGTTPPVSRGYYGAGAGPGRR